MTCVCNHLVGEYEGVGVSMDERARLHVPGRLAPQVLEREGDFLCVIACTRGDDRPAGTGRLIIQVQKTDPWEEASRNASATSSFGKLVLRGGSGPKLRVWQRFGGNDAGVAQTSSGGSSGSGLEHPEQRLEHPEQGVTLGVPSPSYYLGARSHLVQKERRSPLYWAAEVLQLHSSFSAALWLS